MSKNVTEMEMEELYAEREELELAIGGISGRDIMRSLNIKEEIEWRIHNSYVGFTAKEIEDELLADGEISERYIKA